MNERSIRSYNGLPETVKLFIRPIFRNQLKIPATKQIFVSPVRTIRLSWQTLQAERHPQRRPPAGMGIRGEEDFRPAAAAEMPSIDNTQHEQAAVLPDRRPAGSFRTT